MDPDFWFEDDMALYLTQKEKKPFKVKNDSNTNSLHRPLEKGDVLPNGSYLYVVSPKGGLYIAHIRNIRGHLTDPNGDALNHSSFRSGQPVICAGHCTIENGNIKKIDIDTGHYRTKTEGLIMACFHLYHQNLIKKECILECYDGTQVTMEEVLADPAYNLIHQEYLEIIQAPDADMKAEQSPNNFSK